MSLQPVTLNDKIPFTLDVSTELENILYCSSINEHLFNVAIFNTKHKQLILEYNDEGSVRYAKIQVKIGEKLYKDSIFKVIITDNKVLESTFNPNFVKPVYVKEIPIKKAEPIPEQVEIVREESISPIIEQEPKKIYEPLKVGGLYEVAVNTTVPMVLIESGEVENIFFCSSFSDQLFNVGIFKTRDAELISEYVVEKREKYVYVDLLFENGDLFHKIKFKIVEMEEQETPISMFNLKTLDNNTKSYVEFTGPKEQLLAETEDITIPEVIITEDTELIQQKQEYAKAIEKARRLEQMLEEQNQLLLEKQKEIQKKAVVVEAANEVEKVIWENIQSKLSTFKKEFTEDFKKDSRKNLDEYVIDKLKKDLETTHEIDQKLREIIEQTESTAKVKDGIKKYVDKAVEAALKEAKRFAASVGGEGGGGSVAVQYAKGGVMDGRLTVNELTVKGGVEFCGDVLPCVTDVHSLGSPTRRWKDLYVSDSSIYIGGVTLSAVGNTFIIPENTIIIGDTINDGDLNVSTSILSAGVDLLDIFAQSAGSVQELSWNPAPYNLSITGGNTVSLTSIRVDLQNYTNNNYLSLSGGNITGSLNIYQNLTVNGNLTALGNSYFVDTIFTTTSALSVINAGKGPALYVFQAAGPYDVASFYDGDGVEVLHVGNAQPGGGGFVGINESYPGAALTVNGAISSNGSISVVSMQASNNVGVGTYAPLYFNLDVNGPTGNGSIGSSYGNLSIGSSSDILINPNNNLLLGPVGNVGIGTITPTVKLTVNGAISSNGTITAEGGNSTEWDSVYNSWNQLSGIYVTTHYLSTNNVLLSAATVTNDINVGGTGYFNHVAAASKSFYIPHPSRQGLHLQYGSLESPYHGVRLTGRSTIQTVCVVKLPHYIKDLVHKSEASVQLTNINHTKSLYVSEINPDENHFIVKRKRGLFDRNKEYGFFWSFTAIRKDIPALQVEI